MATFTGIFMLLYLVIIVGIGIFLLVLLSRFVRAHERGADALAAIAKKLPVIGQPGS